eukprot:2075726-Rhodomonas_salina.1
MDPIDPTPSTLGLLSPGYKSTRASVLAPSAMGTHSLALTVEERATGAQVCPAITLRHTAASALGHGWYCAITLHHTAASTLGHVRY